MTAELNGFVGRTHVRQTFHNPLRETIEAVYAFPLPDNAAVDGMTMTMKARTTGKHVGECAKGE